MIVLDTNIVSELMRPIPSDRVVSDHLSSLSLT